MGVRAGNVISQIDQLVPGVAVMAEVQDSLIPVSVTDG